MSFLATLRSLVMALVVFGLFAGSMAYAMPASMGQTVILAGSGQDVAMPCGMMAGMHSPDSKAKGEMPCNSITPDCVKKMACLQIVGLPDRWEPSIGVVTLAEVAYPVSRHLLAGLTRKPELSPPLAA